MHAKLGIVGVLLLAVLILLPACTPASESPPTPAPTPVPATTPVGQLPMTDNVQLGPLDEDALYWGNNAALETAQSHSEWHRFPTTEYGLYASAPFFLEEGESVEVMVRSDCAVAFDNSACDFSGGIRTYLVYCENSSSTDCGFISCEVKRPSGASDNRWEARAISPSHGTGFYVLVLENGSGNRVLCQYTISLIQPVPEPVPTPTPEPTTPYPEPALAPAPAPEPAFIVANKPSGPPTGEVNQTLTFFIATSDVSGTPEYCFDWGDGSYSSWSSSVNASHSWSSLGTYTIRAKARCGYINSEWSSGKVVTIEPEPLAESKPLPRNPFRQPEAMMSYITPEDPEIQEAVEDILSGEWRWAYSDFNALRQWLSTHVSYVYDQSVHGTSEYWQLPAETLELGTGDCEDFTILLCTLLRAYGVPSDQVYVAAAFSEGEDHGHAFLFERYYTGIWRAIEPQVGVWHVFVIGDIDPSEYDRFYCFNDQGYLTEKPAPPPGTYEFEAGYSFWPITRGASVEFERYLDTGERVTGLMEWGKDSMREHSDIIYDWTITAYDQYDDAVFTWSGTELGHGFSFTASQAGIYRIEILKRDYLARCGKMTIEPEDWVQN